MLGASSDHIYDANYKVDRNQHSEKNKNKKRKIVVKNFLVSNNNNHNNKL